MLIAMAVIGCAKERESVTNGDEKRYFDAWMAVHYPDAEPSGNGIYIIPEEGSATGSGDPITDSTYVMVHYTVKDLDGNISSTSEEEVAKRLGTYSETSYYGPTVWYKSSTNAGVEDMLNQMFLPGKDGSKGSRMTAVIPGWLMTSLRYSTPEEYLAKVTSGTNSIYTIEIMDACTDIFHWQIGNIESYIKDPESTLEQSMLDTTKTGYGYYYDTIGFDEVIGEEDTTKFGTDTTIYIKYTGKRLDGQVFDTTDEKIAKQHNIYNASKTYGPVEISWGESYSDITMGSSESSVISGFAKILWDLQYRVGTLDEKGLQRKAIGIFTSAFGYGGSGSGAMIPGYSPLIFEIEIIKEEEEN